MRRGILHAWTATGSSSRCETGLQWYCVFRSLIASCALHQLNPQTYLEQVLRLAPHWPVHRMLELAPKYWMRTLSRLDEHHRAILVQPWNLDSRVVSASEDAA